MMPRMQTKRQKLAEDTREVLEKARQLYLNEDATAALEIMEGLLEADNHPRIRRFYSRLLIHFGREDEAREVLASVIDKIFLPTFLELALVGSNVSSVIWSRLNRFIYFPVPKCGSTTVKNAIMMLEGGDNLREDVHYNVEHLNRWVNREKIATEAPAAWRFAVVRDPIERVRSFHRGNIDARRALIEDAGGRDSFYGLSTRPSYEEFVDKFESYCRIFIGVRHHVMPLSRYIGPDPSLFHWVGNLAQTGQLLAEMAKRAGQELPAIREMQSPGGIKETSVAEEGLRSFYEDDYSHYGRWF